MQPTILIGCALTVVSCLALPAAASPTLNDFVRHPSYGDAKISPSGQYLAISVDRGSQDVLTVLDTETLRPIKINQLPENRSVHEFHWVSDDRLVFNAARKTGGYATPLLTGEWFAVNADGSFPRPLIFYGSRDATQRGLSVSNERFSLLDELGDDARNVMMEAYYPRSREGVGTYAVMVDTLTGRRSNLARAPRENCTISLDQNKQPHLALCVSSRDESGEFDERSELYLRENQQWKQLNNSVSAGRHVQVLRTTDTGTVYALQNDQAGTGAVGTLDAASGEFRPLFQDPVSDISRYIWSADGNHLLAVTTSAGVPTVHMLMPDHPDANAYMALADAFPGQLVTFPSATKDGSKILVSVVSDRNAGELYLYDRQSGQARFLMQRRPWLAAEAMARVETFSIVMPEGHTLHGFITVPRNGNAQGAPPLIINPHGGPIGPRDEWTFNWETQLLASRGYAVLQVNFRGSGGYGKAFRDAGHGQWGGAIQDDIIAATRWAVANGYGDGDRVCIYGGSFGGYSALMAPVRAPGLFKCAFGYVGVYDLEMMFNKGDIQQSVSGQRYLRRTLGSDRAGWAQNSPAQRAAEVGIPVYLAAGARDMRTPPEQTEFMQRALVQAGNPPEGIIIQSGEMHGFYDVSNRENLYTEMLEFFGRHIGDR